MDQIVRVIAKDAPVKAMAISARDTVQRARAIHDCWPVASAALGRLLMAASMMGAVMKGEDGAVTLETAGQEAVFTKQEVALVRLYPRF